MRRFTASDRVFYLVFGALTLLAAAPFWRTRLLPMQDYSNFLLFARAYGDCRIPSSPFFGTYTTGFAFSPLLLPILAIRAVAAFSDIETGGRVVWTLYAVGLPLASLDLLRLLGRDRWAVLLVFPLVLSYWVVGGFFAFATSAPLLVLGLASAVRWLARPSWRTGAVFGAIVAALHLWHSLAFAQILLDFGVLWLLARMDGLRARLLALVPTLPALGLFAVWMLTTVHGRSPGSKPAAWPPFYETVTHFFEFIGPILPEATASVMLLGLVVAASAAAVPRRVPSGPVADLFRARNPFGWLAALAALCYAVLPSTWFGVEGLSNRQSYLAALLLVFAWSVPARPVARAAVLALVGGAGALALVDLGGRFAAFGRESGGASRLMDRLAPGETLLAPIGIGASAAFPGGKPLIALELIASVRRGGLPNGSFAGYNINFIRYAGDKNPMPGISGPGWIDHPALTRFDYVLVRGPTGIAGMRTRVVREVARDGDWTLFGVCGSKSRPRCN